MKRGQPSSHQIDPFRKRSLNLSRDVALMMHAFGQDMPGMKEAWHMNQALRDYFTRKGYAKRLPALEKQFPAA